MVIGAHCCVTQLLERRGERFDVTRSRLEQEVRYANITIIEGHDASQYGIGIASARIAEMILRDERAVVPIGSYNPTFGVTLSLPSVVGLTGAVSVLQPDLSGEARGPGKRCAIVKDRAPGRSALNDT